MFEKFDASEDQNYWYLRDEDKHESVFAYVESIEGEPLHRTVRQKNVAHAQLYSNRYEVGLAGEFSDDHFRDGYAALTDNLIKRGVDTATSLQGTGRVKPTLLTDGADWDRYVLSEDIGKIGWGLWQGLNVNAKRTRQFRDASIFGKGCLWVTRSEGRISVERVIIDDIVVDEQSLPTSGDLPRQIHRLRYIAPEILVAKYAEDDEELAETLRNASCGWRRRTDWRGSRGTDVKLVIESIHLPSAPGAGDGRRVVCTDNATLVDEEYDKDYYPCVFFDYDEPVTGFYAPGIPELGLGHQIRLNQLHDFKRKAQDLMSAPRWWVNSASRVLDEVFSNEMGIVGHYSGNSPPVSQTPQAVHPEIHQEEQHIEESFMRAIGISAMSAYASRPEGVEHAVALRELSDSQAKRHIERTARFEDSAVELFKLLIHTLKDMVLAGESLDAFPEQELIDRVEWDDVDLFSPTFTVQVQTASMLGETPSGRKQSVVEILQYGGFELLGGGDPQLGMQEALRLLGHPDLGQNRKRVNASMERIEWVIGRLRKGELVMPEQYDNLQLGIPTVVSAMQDYEIRGCPEEILDCFRNWVDQAVEIESAQRAAANAAAQPAMPAPMEPQADMSAAMPPV